MRGHTAAGLVLAAVSLGLLNRESKRSSQVGHILAAVVLGLGLLTSVEYFLPFFEVFTPYFLLMSPIASLCFVGVGVALLSLDSPKRGAVLLSEFATVVVLLAALLGVAGYTYDTTGSYTVAYYTALALHTAVAFLILGIGILASRPDRGLTALLTRQTSGSVLARRLLPGAVAVPFVLGWLRVRAEHIGVFEFGFGTAVLTTSMIAIFIALIWRTAVSLDRADRARQRAEEALRRLKEELEVRVEKRTAALATANEELTAFGFTVSHDLRAPLRHIGGFIRLLEEHSGSDLDEMGRRYVQIISESAGRMGNLIDDMLTLSRVGRATIAVTRVDLRQLVNDAIQELAPITADRAVEWRIGALPIVWVDPTLMRTAIVNLISNAVKYTRPRNPARIEIGSEEDGDWVVCFVRDNGVGFNMEFSDKLFGVFQRLHRAEEFEGTGIGLASVRRIVERHGGRTWAEGEVDRGATIYFSLPKKPENER